MAGPIKLKDWISGPHVLVPTPGAGADADLVALVLIAEPLSAGPPPVKPSLVKRMAAPWRVGRAMVGSGQRRTMAMETEPRTAGWNLRWASLTQTERDLLVAFLREDLNGTRFGMDIEVDGAGETASLVVLRPIGMWNETLVGPRKNGTVGGVWKAVYTVELVAEELF